MRLDWPNCGNARDLGGTPTRDGGRVRAGALIRSDSHARMTAASVEALRGHGLGLILDLRWFGSATAHRARSRPTRSTETCRCFPIR
ncbi:tyrosine-protein phosphatase [Actinoplanes sp. NEAU-H7]|uniref:Tyrosine-protein phosphatase n=1 Tax=Actinoplanes flavus TaxID=2820290 RepID=A0ABS3US48_9ACTN|nr:tyrosine-protein phosphatase [Actinoplanes flavus]